MKNLRLLIAAVCLSVLGLLPVTAAAAETEIILWHSYRAEEKTALEKVVAEYNKANAGKAKVTVTYAGSALVLATSKAVRFTVT